MSEIINNNDHNSKAHQFKIWTFRIKGYLFLEKLCLI